ALETGLRLSNLQFHEQRRLHREYIAVIGTYLYHLVFFYKLQGVTQGLLIDGDLIISLVIHEIVEISVVVQVLHIHSVDSCLRELLCGTEGFLHHASADNVFQFCSNKSSALSWFYVLELKNLNNVSVDFQRNAISEISC